MRLRSKIKNSEKTSFISMQWTSFRWNFLDKRSRGTVRVINFSYPRKAITIFFFLVVRKKGKIEEEE